MNFSENLKKLQGLPDSKKKIVLWTIVVILGLIMGFFWINGTINSLQKLGQSGQVILPQVELPVDETADWKTYTNAEYGFEVKYPNTWYVKEIGQGIVTGGIYFSPEEPDKNDETGGMAFTNEALSISVNNFAEKNSLLEYAENYLNLSAITESKIENIKIGGEDGLKIMATCDGVGCGNPMWFIAKNGKVFVFSPNLSDNVDTFEKIISTFKFNK